MQEITTQNRRSVAPRPDPELSAATRNLVCWIPSDPNEPVGLTRSLSGAERERLERRIVDIEASLDARDKRQVERSIAAMMLTIPSTRASADEAQAVVMAYAATLANDFPPWAVERAAMRFASGEVPGSNPAFAPSAAELRKEARRLLVPHVAEVERLKSILNGVFIEKVERHPPSCIPTEEREEA